MQGLSFSIYLFQLLRLMFSEFYFRIQHSSFPSVCGVLNVGYSVILESFEQFRAMLGEGTNYN